jgi:hypothetical protein
MAIAQNRADRRSTQRADSGTSLHGTPADVRSGPPSERKLYPVFLDMKNPPIGLPRRADYRATRFVAEWPHPLAGTTLLGKQVGEGVSPTLDALARYKSLLPAFQWGV